MTITTTSLPRIPSKTADALASNGWTVSKTVARRQFGAGVMASIASDGTFFVLVGSELRARGHEPQHETLEWTICCTAMEANEVAWSQPEYKAQFVREG